MKTIIGSTLTLWVLSLFHALPVAAQTQSPVKVGVVLNFAADGGAAGFYLALGRRKHFSVCEVVHTRAA